MNFPPFVSYVFSPLHVCQHQKNSFLPRSPLFLFLMLIFIQLIQPLIHLYIYLLAPAITLCFFISLQRLSRRLIRNRCSRAGGYLQCVCGRREQFPGQKRLREERGSKKETLNATLPWNRRPRKRGEDARSYT